MSVFNVQYLQYQACSDRTFHLFGVYKLIFALLVLQGCISSRNDFIASFRPNFFHHLLRKTQKIYEGKPKQRCL